MTKSQSFLFFCVFFILGIFVGSYFFIEVWMLFLAVGLFISLAFLFRKNPKYRIIFLLLIFFLFGFLRADIVKMSADKTAEINNMNDKKVVINGKIIIPPEMKNGKQKLLITHLKNIKSGQIIEGKLIAYADRYPEYNYGDLIRVEGKIQTPENFDGFQYRDYLFSQNIFYIIYYPKVSLLEYRSKGLETRILEVGEYSNGIIKKIFPQPHAGILNGMIFGAKSEISDEVLDKFRKTGTSHIIAVSGSNMTIIAVIMMYFFLMLGLNRNRVFYFSLIGIAFFVILVGYQPSAIRAAIMGSIILVAVKVGRLSNMENAIVFAAVLMLAQNPNLIRYDVGFQLSYLAVLGIVYLFPILNKIFEKVPEYFNLKSIFLITISAQIATFPIIISNFEYFSLVSTFANIMILPFVPIVTIGGIVSVFFGSINLFLAEIVSFPIWLILSYQIKVIEFFSSFDISIKI